MKFGSYEVREYYSQEDFLSAKYENSKVLSRCATDDQASQEVNYWESMGIPERMLFYVDRNDCRVNFNN
jgi:hypothetical protein